MGAVHHLEVCLTLHLAYLRVAPVLTVRCPLCGVSRHFNYSSVKTNMSNKVKVITQDTALCFCIVLPADSVSVPNTPATLQSEGAVTAKLSRAAVARRQGAGVK